MFTVVTHFAGAATSWLEKLTVRWSHSGGLSAAIGPPLRQPASPSGRARTTALRRTRPNILRTLRFPISQLPCLVGDYCEVWVGCLTDEVGADGGERARHACGRRAG